MRISKKLSPIDFSGFRSGLLVAMCAVNMFAQAGEIVFKLEEPQASGTYSGIGNLRGWAVSSVGVDRVELFIDGVFQTNIPSGGSRGDVAGSFPDFPASDKSGFSMAYAYLKLSGGSHRIKIRVFDNDGDVQQLERTFVTKNFGTSLINDANAVDATLAQVVAMDNTIELKGMIVNGEAFNTQLMWSPNSQSLVFSDIIQENKAGCVDVSRIANGTIVESSFEFTDGDIISIESFETRYVTVTDTGATVEIHIETSFSDGAGNTINAITDLTSVEQYRILDNFLYSEQVDLNSEVTFDGVVLPEQMSTLVFEPAKLQGPVKTYCSGQEWNSPSVLETFTFNGELFSEENGSSHTGKVLLINEPVTTPAGTFSTVLVERILSDDLGGRVWIDQNTGVVVKSETIDVDGTVTAGHIVTQID